jgi:phosphonate transport system ATP-binding protein
LPANPIIRLRDVTRSFGETTALGGVDLEIHPGERIALVGSSGAGKTTLFRLLNLSILPRAGSCRILGHEAASLHGARLRETRSQIATIHQHHDVVGRLNVAKHILAGRLGRWGAVESLGVFLWPRARFVEEARAVARRVGIAEKLAERTDRLSGGERQRVAIARAIFQEARLLLADEPVASVDPALADEILRLLVESATEDGRTLVVSLHQPDLALRWFPRIVAMREGRIAFDLPSAEVDAARLAALFAADRPKDA